MATKTHKPSDNPDEFAHRLGPRAHWNSVLLRILLGAGLRVNEAGNLNLETLDHPTGIRTIPSRKSMTTRMVQIPPELAHLLTTYLTANQPSRRAWLFKAVRKLRPANRTRSRRLRDRT